MKLLNFMYKKGRFIISLLILFYFNQKFYLFIIKYLLYLILFEIHFVIYIKISYVISLLLILMIKIFKIYK